ncbi:MAG: hypothetical protein U1F43_29525 [Myxococcota bacterium]
MSRPPLARVCPQCGTATDLASCDRDGWSTVPLRRATAIEPARRVLGRWVAGGVLGQDGPFTTWSGVELTGAPARIVFVALAPDLELAEVARMQRRARLLEDLAHPGLARTLATGIDGEGSLVVVSTQLAGPTLAHALADGPLDPSAARAPRRAALRRARRAAHDRRRPPRPRPRPHPRRATRTATSASSSRTPASAASCDGPTAPTTPRSCCTRARARPPTRRLRPARNRAVTRHADLYAAGAILYEMLTGRTVFVERTPADLMVAHLTKAPPSPIVDGTAREGPLVDLILCCLQKKPWDRPESAALVRDRLTAAALDPKRLARPRRSVAERIVRRSKVAAASALGRRLAMTTPLVPTRPPAAIASRPRRRWWLAGASAVAIVVAFLSAGSTPTSWPTRPPGATPSSSAARSCAATATRAPPRRGSSATPSRAPCWSWRPEAARLDRTRRDSASPVGLMRARSD